MSSDPSSQQPHQSRQVAESFGSDPERYDRARPRYPEAMIDAIIAGSPGQDFLDVGCGTGIVARQFQGRGCRVLGVDVDQRMAGLARQAGIVVEVSKFEDWDADGRRFDAVIAGQAWHWVDPVAGADKAAAVLRPSGRLAVFWNVFQLPAGIAEALVEIHRRVLPDVPGDVWTRPALDLYSSMFSKAADAMARAAAFGPPEQWRYDWDKLYTTSQWLDVMPTQGLNSQLPPAKLDELLAAAGAAIDAAGGSFTMRYTSVAVTATLLTRG